ncbi:hypothetical protein PF002_g10505 [Phytophthora fragariae]|uniref:Uncharacterized protein n=1 Tax=Phytophthora fragariae TaxID=53985 RepID=A0A6A3ZQ57_9STRA|nr:hypothetical protein PF002_g10505 [Phytophthora fragariae]
MDINGYAVVREVDSSRVLLTRAGAARAAPASSSSAVGARPTSRLSTSPSCHWRVLPTIDDEAADDCTKWLVDEYGILTALRDDSNAGNFDVCLVKRRQPTTKVLTALRVKYVKPGRGEPPRPAQRKQKRRRLPQNMVVEGSRAVSRSSAEYKQAFTSVAGNVPIFSLLFGCPSVLHPS